MKTEKASVKVQTSKACSSQIKNTTFDNVNKKVKETEQTKFLKREISLKKVEKQIFYANIAACTGPPPTHNSNKRHTKVVIKCHQ